MTSVKIISEVSSRELKSKKTGKWRKSLPESMFTTRSLEK